MSSLSKNTYREILRSPGRFLAILAIIVLGSGFFVGLRVSEEAMTATADRYLRETSFYDYSVATTLGLTDADVEALLADPDILDAEGSVEVNALVSLDGETEIVYAFYSLPERINTPALTEGRLPQAPDECLADSWSNLTVGDKVYISENNDQDTLDMLTVRELTVTGVATSPLYLNFERGSASIGSGTVTSFCYVPMAAFDTEYYTSVYLRSTGMAGAYSGEYDSRSEALEPHFTDLADQRAQARYDTVVGDAEAELADGWDEYNDAYDEYLTKRADAEAELEDARRELEDAWRELEDGKKELEDGKAELDSSEIELQDAKRELTDAAAQIAEGETELADGKRELTENERTLSDAKAELDEAKTTLDDSRRELDDGWAELETGAAELEAQRADGQRELDEAQAELDGALRTLEDGEAQYSENLALYEDGEARYDDGARELDDAWDQLRDGQREYEDGLADYNYGLAQYEENKPKLEAAKAALDAAKETLDAGQAGFDTLTQAMLAGINEKLPGLGLTPYESVDALLLAAESGDFIATTAINMALQEAKKINPDVPDDAAGLLAKRDELLSGWADYEAGSAQYEQNLAALNDLDAQLRAAASQLEAARRELDDGWAQYYSGLAELRSSRAQLDDAKAQLEDGRAELDLGWEEYNEGAAQLEDARAEFASAITEAERELAQANDRLLDAEKQYAQGLEEYNEGLAAYEDGLQKFNDGRAELEKAEADLNDARQKYADGVAAYEDGLQKYNDGVKKYEDGVAEYQDGLQEYKDGLAEYEDAKREAEQEFADAEAELADARDELADARREIDEIEYPEAYLLGRWANVGYSCFESDASIVRSISSVFPLFFFLVAALICVTTVSRMVEEQRSQLGVLMALGYSPMRVMAKFLIYSGSATVIGCSAGILLGSWAIPWVVWQAYDIMYGFSSNIQFFFDWKLSAVTFLAYLAAMLAVTYISCRREINDVPANVIRPKPPKSGKRVLLERIPFIWNRLSFLWKVTVRNIFRYKSRVFMMILGVAGCTALMLTGMGINDSIKNVVDYQFTEVNLYDFTVTFNGHLTAEERQAFLADTADVSESALFLHQSTVTASANRAEKEVQISAVDAAEVGSIGEFVSFHRGSAPLPFPGQGQALINTGLAEDLGLSVGDTFEIRPEEGPSVTLTVSGVYDNYIYNTVYVSTASYPAGGDPEINFALVIKRDGVDTGEALASILRRDGVLTASASLDLRERIGNMMSSLIYIVLLTVICAAALAFVVIYNLTNINIQERLRELATVKVLGFYNMESALYVLRENMLLTVLGAAAGVPMGLALNAYVISCIDLDIIHFTPRVLLPSYLWSIALTFLFSVLVDAFMYRRLTRINPAAALKAAE